MSADSTSALGGAGLARAAAMPMPAATASVDRAQASAAPAADAPAHPQVVVPKRAELTLDPQARAREVKEALAKLNEQMQSNGRALAFSVDNTLDRTVITVTNSETGNVVRQIPDESLLRVAHNIDRIAGLLKDETI